MPEQTSTHPIARRQFLRQVHSGALRRRRSQLSRQPRALVGEVTVRRYAMCLLPTFGFPEML
jgi:hypothetical protein